MPVPLSTLHPIAESPESAPEQSFPSPSALADEPDRKITGSEFTIIENTTSTPAATMNTAAEPPDTPTR